MSTRGPAPAFVARMISRSARGFTLVEVLVALVLLTVGVMALLGSSAMVSRMIGRGRGVHYRGAGGHRAPRASPPHRRLYHAAMHLAPVRERQRHHGRGLRALGRCAAAGAGLSRRVSVILAYRDPRGPVRDTLAHRRALRMNAGSPRLHTRRADGRARARRRRLRGHVRPPRAKPACLAARRWSTPACRTTFAPERSSLPTSCKEIGYDSDSAEAGLGAEAR